MTERERLQVDLDRSLLRGIAWTGGVKWLVQLLGWTSTLVIVRHVSPADYGIVGSASLYLGLLGLASDFGVGAAVIRMRDMPTSQVEQLNGAAAALGGVGMLLGLLAAWPLGLFFRAPQLPLVLAALSSTLLVAGFRSVPLAAMQRDLRFRDIAFVEAAQALTGSAVTVVLAIAGWGYWALCAGSLVQSLAYSLLVMRRQPLALRRPRAADMKDPLALSRHVLVGQLSWWTYSNADFVVIGRVLGQAALGTYLLAWEFASLPVEKITNLVTRVTPAIFSALQSDIPALRSRFLALSEGIAMLTLPASWGLALIADDFVLVAFGDSWLAAVTPLRLLCLYISLRSVVTLLPQVLIALGDSATVARNSLLFVTAMPLAFLLGSRWGTTGVALAWVAVFPILNVPIYRRVFALLELSPRAYVFALFAPILGAVTMAGALLALRPAMLKLDSPLHRIAIAIPLGALVYSGIAIWPQRRRIREVLRLLRA